MEKVSNTINFSIIVPVYNAEKSIKNCLESIRKQTIDDYEIILINDGSKDSSEKIIKEFIDENPDMSIVYVAQENKGPANARGNGIRFATNNYIAFLDADDIWYKKKLETARNVIEEKRATFVYNNEFMIMPDGTKKKSAYYALSDKPVEDLIIKGNPISTSTVVVEADLLKRNHTFLDGKEYGEDIACWIALARAGARFEYIDVPLGEYRRVETSLTLNDEEYLKNTYERSLLFYDYLEDYGYTKQQISHLKMNRIALNLYSMGRYYQKNGFFNKARESYWRSIKTNPNYKSFIGYIIALLKVKK